MSPERNPSTEPFIAGQGVHLRGVVRDDLVAYARWLDSPAVTQYLEMGGRPTREADLEAFWRQANEMQDAVVFTVVEAASGRAIGVVGLYLIQWVCRRAQFNILIGEPDAWDKGYGGECARLMLAYGFDRLNLESIQLGVNAENKRAIRSYEKAGFVHEGVRRRFLYCHGRYADMVVMSVLRSEYEAGKRP